MVMVVIIHDCFSVIMMLLVLLYIIHNYIHIIRLLLDLYRHWLVAEGHGFSLEFFSWFYVFSFFFSECKFLIQKIFLWFLLTKNKKTQIDALCIQFDSIYSGIKSSLKNWNEDAAKLKKIIGNSIWQHILSSKICIILFQDLI